MARAEMELRTQRTGVWPFEGEQAFLTTEFEVLLAPYRSRALAETRIYIEAVDEIHRTAALLDWGRRAASIAVGTEFNATILGFPSPRELLETNSGVLIESACTDPSAVPSPLIKAHEEVEAQTLARETHGVPFRAATEEDIHRVFGDLRTALSDDQ